jgi:hypothetical protein
VCEAPAKFIWGKTPGETPNIRSWESNLGELGAPPAPQPLALSAVLDGKNISSLPSAHSKILNHLVSKEPAVMPLSQHISFLEWFAKSHSQ